MIPCLRTFPKCLLGTKHCIVWHASFLQVACSLASELAHIPKMIVGIARASMKRANSVMTNKSWFIGEDYY